MGLGSDVSRSGLSDSLYPKSLLQSLQTVTPSVHHCSNLSHIQTTTDETEEDEVAERLR